MGKTKKHKKEKKSKRKRSEKKKSKKNEKDAEKNSKKQESSLIPVDLMCSKSLAPETPQEYQQRQSQIRHEIDPISGRRRLIKGDGEILEEIVSRKRHLQINKLATQADGQFFQNTVKKNLD